MLKNTIKKIIVAIADSLTVRNFVIFANINYFLIIALAMKTDLHVDTTMEGVVLSVVVLLLHSPFYVATLLDHKGDGRRSNRALFYLFIEGLCILAAFEIYTAGANLTPS